MSNKIQIAKEFYRAFAAGDRNFVETHLTNDFTFSEPPDPLLDHNIKNLELILSSTVDNLRAAPDCQRSLALLTHASKSNQLQKFGTTTAAPGKSDYMLKVVNRSLSS